MFLLCLLLGLLKQVQLFLRRDGLLAGPFCLPPRIFSLLPVYLPHLLELSLMLFLLTLLRIALQRALLSHLAPLNLLWSRLRKCEGGRKKEADR
jgi:hypothetical protein